MNRIGASRILCLAAASVLAHSPMGASAAHAETDGEHVEEVMVYGRAEQKLGRAGSASEGFVGHDDLRLQPLLRAGELIETVPGMVATQHSGTGKANQYFLRGFNLDHGTDFSARIYGVPLNMRTHGHGQGYLDLNPIIPELVESATYRKGTHQPRDGDFSAAGAVEFQYGTQAPDSRVQATLGEFGYGRGLVIGSVESEAGTTTGALDLTRYEGPWQLDEDLEQLRMRLAHTTTWLGGRARVALSGYDSKWTSTDQIPRRAVPAGTVDRLGFVDPDLGGRSERWAVNVNFEHSHLRAGAYHVVQNFTLWSNFTYALADALNGDEFEQRDERSVSGLWLDVDRTFELLGRPAEWDTGLDLRVDEIDEVGLHATVSRRRIGTVRDDRVTQRSFSAWNKLELVLGERTRAIAGLRLDAFDWNVNARLAANGGQGDDHLWSPSISVAHRFDFAEAYASWGRGFHSNDVRGTTISVDPASGTPADLVDALVQAQGWELGIRVERGARFNATVALFALELDSELVFVGDAGATEANDGTDRLGIEVAVFAQLTDTLAGNATWTRTDAEFDEDQGGGRSIPGAVDETFSLGLNWAHSTGLFASTRLRWLGKAPLLEDNSARSKRSTLLNVGGGWRRGALELRLDVFNALDSKDDDIAYFYASRLDGEPAAGIADVHFHPLEPRSVRGTVTLHLGAD